MTLPPVDISVAAVERVATLLIAMDKIDVPSVAQADAGHMLRALRSALTASEQRVKELETLINTPHTAEFLESVKLEAAHQRERWASEHDAGKTDADWFWLVGYLAGKALHKPEKQVHHIITTAAALLNWHKAVTGEDNRMRPGIAP